MLLKQHLILLAQELFLRWFSILQLRNSHLLIELLEDELFALFSECLLLAQLGVWKTLVKNHVEVEVVTSKELNGVRLRIN